MTKYFCDICEKEIIGTSYDYLLPIMTTQIDYNSPEGYKLVTSQQIESKTFQLCPSCRADVARAIKELKR